MAGNPRREPLKEAVALPVMPLWACPMAMSNAFVFNALRGYVHGLFRPLPCLFPVRSPYVLRSSFDDNCSYTTSRAIPAMS